MSTENAELFDAGINVDQLNYLEISAICSNLARGCEKQYKQDEADHFNKLAEFYKQASDLSTKADFTELAASIEKDLKENFPDANRSSNEAADRGALRALVWGEKVTKIHKSLLARYARSGDSLIENKDVFVCSICGFVYIGDQPPELCPVCKVPNWKFEKIKKEAAK